ncbi:hypothetical protein [Nocardioides solisilvae]|uniref:hypothetical protein n=1 Tax=Nocardioides solisilvae TaxID=1542435 RepID=UPI000D75022B|nr:hypothetical protein [Nocardioides solisilvae]
MSRLARRLVPTLLPALLLALGPALPAVAGDSQFPEVLTPFVVTSPGHLQVRATGQVKDPDDGTRPVDLNVFVHDDEGTQLFQLTAGPDGFFDTTVTVRKGGPVRVDIWAIDQLPGGAVHYQADGTSPYAWDPVSGLSLSVFVDTAPPVTTITSGPSGPVQVEPGTTRAVPFTFTATEAATFTCSLDAVGTTSRDWQPCASPHQVSVGVGAWEFRVRARDAVGNQGAEAVQGFTVVPAQAVPVEVDPVPGQVAVQVGAVRRKSRLRVAVAPASAAVDYALVVERQVRKRGRKTWKQVTRSTTRGADESRVLDLRRGRYRVLVPAQHGLAAARSKVVRLRR